VLEDPIGEGSIITVAPAIANAVAAATGRRIRDLLPTRWKVWAAGLDGRDHGTGIGESGEG